MPLVLVGALCGAVGFALGRAAPRDEPVATTAITAEERSGASPRRGMPEGHPDLHGGDMAGDLAEDPHEMADPGDRPPAPAPEGLLEGTLKDHVDVAQYTYLHVALEAGETWAAVYKAPVKDGTHVVVEHAARLEGFHSRELNRDFKEIWFGSLAKPM